MKLDALKQFTILRAQLTQERQRLAARLEEIDRVLGDHAGSAPTLKAPRVQIRNPRAPTRRTRGIKRVKNPISLKKAVVKVTTKNPLTKPEILAAIQKLGWTTTSKKPQKMLDVLLYGKKPKFKNQGGKFSPA